MILILLCASFFRSASVLEVVDVKLGDRSYPIYIGPGLLKSRPEFITKHVHGKKVLTITNTVGAECRYIPMT